MPNDFLSALHDVQQPSESISAWPLAWGWYALALLLLAVLLTVLALYWRYRKNRYRREALAELIQLAEQEDSAQLLYDLAELLKRVAVHNNKQAAQLHGKAWQDYLQTAMPEQQAELLALGRYQPVRHYDKAALIAAVKQWIKVN